MKRWRKITVTELPDPPFFRYVLRPRERSPPPYGLRPRGDAHVVYHRQENACAVCCRKLMLVRVPGDPTVRSQPLTLAVGSERSV